MFARRLYFSRLNVQLAFHHDELECVSVSLKFPFLYYRTIEIEPSFKYYHYSGSSKFESYFSAATAQLRQESFSGIHFIQSRYLISTFLV